MSERKPRRRPVNLALFKVAVALLLLVVGSVVSPAQDERERPTIVSRIKRVPVSSTALATIGYSKRLQALEVEFLNGAIYRYLDVPPQLHREMMAADSKTRFYHQHVRGQYRSVYVRARRTR